VNVACPALHRVRQDQVHELDDRRFLGGLFERRQVHLRFFAGKFQRRFFPGKVFHHLVELLDTLDIAVKLVNRLADCCFRRHHRLYIESSHELDIVHSEDVGRIRHRNGQSRAHARKWHNLITHSGFLRHQLDDGGIYLVEFQINGRHAVLPRKHSRNIVITDQAQLHQACAQPAATFFLVFKRLLKLIRSDQAVFDQNFAES